MKIYSEYLPTLPEDQEGAILEFLDKLTESNLKSVLTPYELRLFMWRLVEGKSLPLFAKAELTDLHRVQTAFGKMVGKILRTKRLCDGRGRAVSEPEMMSLDALGISTRAGNICFNAGLFRLGDLTCITTQTFLKSRGCGWKTLREMRELLASYGLEFLPETHAPAEPSSPQEEFLVAIGAL